MESNAFYYRRRAVEERMAAQRAVTGSGAGLVQPGARLAFKERHDGFDGAQLEGLVAVELEFHAGIFWRRRSRSSDATMPL